MSNNFNLNNDDNNIIRNGRNIDRTSRNVDRTNRSVDRIGGDDRTSGVDRASYVDRTSGIDRTSNVERVGREPKAMTPAERRAAEYNYFPELNEQIIEPETDVAEFADEAASISDKIIDLFSGKESEPVDTSDSVPYVELSSQSYEDIENVYSGHIGSEDDIIRQSHTDDIENISSSSPRDTSIIDKLEGEKKSKNRKPRSKVARILSTIGKIAASAFFVMIIVGCIVTVAFMVYVFGFVDDSIDDLKLDQLTLNYTTKIYVEDQSYTPEQDDDGNIIGEPVKWIEYQDLCYENRTWVNLNSINQNVIDAYVAGEDERFYTHSGVDFKRTIGSFVNMFIDIYGSKQGGSTITQQLIKNLSGDDEQSPIRKIREIMRARNLEQEFHKDTIMECYLNVIYLGNNAYGIEAAAEYYFGKTANDLSIAEAACIAAITKSPEGYDPIKKPQRNKERRDWIINNMHDVKGVDGEPLITLEERDAALSEELNFVVGNTTEDGEGANSKGEVYSYFTDAIIEQVVADLMAEKGYSKDGAENVLYRSGLKIYATMDTDVQATVDAVFCNEDNFTAIPKIEDKAQAAITVMDYNGHVVASYGGRGEKTGSRDLNRATQSKRQTGSAMKPIGVYAPALDANLITWGTTISNEALKVGNINYHNYDHSTSKSVTCQNALERSLNLVPLRILQSYGARKSFDFLTQKLGFTTLVESVMINGKEYNDIGLSQLALGSMTYGAYTDEMTAAFAVFGNGGVYHAPTYYSLVTNYDGKETILEYNSEGTQAISSSSAYIMNRMLNTVVTGSAGTGRSAGFDGWNNNIFAKTGTTSDNKDRTFVGGTPYYCAYVWFGCDIPKPMNGISGNPALKLWKPVMQEIHKDLKKINFPSDKGVTTATFCLDSGKIAGEGCANTATGYFKKDYMPKCDGAEHPVSSVVSDPSSEVASTPASSAPASSAPASSAPATSTPASSAPATSTPASSAPATSTPASSAPASSTPAASAPAASAPASSTPAASAPASSAPASSAPAAVNENSQAA